MKFFGRKILISTVLSLVTFSCSETKGQKEYFHDLGEIPFDENLDDINFKVCHEDITFPFNYGGVGLAYIGEKRKLVNTIEGNYSYPETEGQTGFITIRFLINCEGQSGRFRVTQMDPNLKETEFENGITQQLLDITKGLDGWKPFERNEKTWDYQQYLTFKIENGLLTDIMP